MSYVETILQPGERVLHTTSLHWLVYLPALFLAILAVAVAVASFLINPTLGLFALILAGFLAAGAVIAWIPAFFRRVTTELAATDRRIVFKTGLVRRRTIEMNMDKVESVNVEQSILGRILGYGTVEIHGTGGGLGALRNIDDPIAFRNNVTAA